MEDKIPAPTDKIMVWGYRHEGPVDESLIPPGKDPQVFDQRTGMNLREAYDPGIDGTN